ncbi:magnesium chelatase [Vibrio parahaemolyticus]|nr:magnesium chelatase [Vibrio parahaemolyticus]OUJ34107.1 magnesium chelatase [Vibrio parahaemolyticus]TOA27146.1 magnesium chelatase [Vibrio parahaemolyticus]HAS6847773.1 magnesium chelatase [Vibrio parahaemolyticus]
MGLAIIHSRASVGVQAPSVSVEVHISNGMPGFTIVGNIYLINKVMNLRSLRVQ